MKHHLPAGLMAGLSAGFIMGFIAWLGYHGGLSRYNPFLVLADVLLPEALAVSSVGIIMSIAFHLLIGMGIGLAFAFFVPYRWSILWGAGLGLFLQIFFGAMITPTFTHVPPFWEMDPASTAYIFSQRFVFGLSLGYFYRLYSSRYLDEKEPLA